MGRLIEEGWKRRRSFPAGGSFTVSLLETRFASYIASNFELAVIW